MTQIDPIGLAQALIRCNSVTPADGGALDVLQQALEGLGFACQRHVFSDDDTPDVDNLYARLGTGQPNFCFAGHTDVVPVGDEAGWTVDPFGAEISDGVLYGRGASDMKSAIAAFVAAVAEVSDMVSEKQGSICLLITGDEEGPSINGTRKLIDRVVEQGEVIDHCLIGEPTCVNTLGDMAKIGRRGSVNGWITVRGVQGHVAYPHLADNPLPRLIELMTVLQSLPLDDGNENFQPSNLEITTIDVDNSAENIIPAKATGRFNVRFNSDHTSDGILQAVRARLNSTGIDYELTSRPNGDCFIFPPGRLSDLVIAASEKVVGVTPELSTNGGTSDGRFIKDYCPLIEFGLANQTMHKVDERAPVADIRALADIYAEILDGYFAG